MVQSAPISAYTGVRKLLEAKGKPTRIVMHPSPGEFSGFCQSVPAEWRDRWLSTKSRDIIEIEAVAPALALQTWPSLASGLWLHFIDNNGALAALVSGSPSTAATDVIVAKPRASQVPLV